VRDRAGVEEVAADEAVRIQVEYVRSSAFLSSAAIPAISPHQSISTPASEIDPERVREMFQRYQEIWDSLSSRWLKFRDNA
jgi:hypothetical protein